MDASKIARGYDWVVRRYDYDQILNSTKKKDKALKILRNAKEQSKSVAAKIWVLAKELCPGVDIYRLAKKVLTNPKSIGWTDVMYAGVDMASFFAPELKMSKIIKVGKDIKDISRPRAIQNMLGAKRAKKKAFENEFAKVQEELNKDLSRGLAKADELMSKTIKDMEQNSRVATKNKNIVKSISLATLGGAGLGIVVKNSHWNKDSCFGLNAACLKASLMEALSANSPSLLYAQISEYAHFNKDYHELFQSALAHMPSDQVIKIKKLMDTPQFKALERSNSMKVTLG